ncbi:rho family-interacting cell polarization regulator 2-like [Notolabrus celidotus]|uniref:rho family-interacting cell polarization regulator 2-like n=1 Tax=Notolabrus celidotus TaxID=1203425 RepID=UPI00148F9B1B|nr:rho family-interacting cell polarization regulator 2-like [Notolabrus celidotus]
MFTGSTKLPPTKTPQPERLDEVYAALRRGLQSYLQVHQLELDSLGQQIRENKRNGRLGSLYEQDKQVKAIERFMRRLEFHLSKVEELYDAYCIQRRLRDGASKMVAAFNLATGSKEARESLSEANKGYRECTEHMCSLESEIESQMGEFHVKMKGLAGFARLCAGDQYEVLMRYGRQRWRLRGRVEVSNKQIWDSEEYIFLPLVTELLSIKVTELKSLANHVVVGSVSCEMLDLFCPLPQTLAVDINDLGTVKLNLEVTWSPFDKDDQTSSSSTVTKRLLSNQSPPDTPSMREQVFYSLLRRQGEMENGTVWSNSSESSDDSSSPALAHHAQRLAASNLLPTSQLSLTQHKSSASTPSLSSNQEEEETESGEVFSQTDAVPNGHLQTHTEQRSAADCTVTNRASVQSADVSETSAELSAVVSSVAPVTRAEAAHVCESGVSQVGVSAAGVKDDAPEDSKEQAGQTEAEDHITKAAGEGKTDTSQAHSELNPPVQESQKPQDAPTVPFPISSSFTQELETALESFDFLNSSDLDEDEEDEEQKQEDKEKKKEGERQDEEDQHKIMTTTVDQQEEEEKEEDDGKEEKDQHNTEEEEMVEGTTNEEEEGKDEESQNKIQIETVEEEEKEKEEDDGQDEEDQHKIEDVTIEEKDRGKEEGKDQEHQKEIEDKTAEEDKEDKKEDRQHAETQNKSEEETAGEGEKEEDDGQDKESQKEMEDKTVEEEVKEEDGQHAGSQNETKEETVEEEEKEEDQRKDETNQNKEEDETVKEEEKEDEEEDFYSGGSCDDEEGGELEILMEAPEGFRNSDEDRFSDSQESSVEDVQDWLRRIERSEGVEEHSEEKGDEQNEEETSHDQEERPHTPGHLATAVF